MPGGRPPKPTQQKIEQGTLRKHREADRTPEPPAMLILPDAPPTLSPRAKNLWNHYGRILVLRKYLADDGGDLLALESLCREYERYLELVEDVHGGVNNPEPEGVNLPKADGGVMRNPKCVELNAAYRNAVRAMAEFGLTPSARARMRSASAPTKATDPFGAFRVFPGGKAQ